MVDSAAIPDPPLQVIYSGRVQGVGFRYTTRRVAKQFAVRGTVRNLSDGTVELCVTGDRGEVLRFLQGVREAMEGYIQAEDFQQLPEPPAAAGFEIVR